MAREEFLLSSKSVVFEDTLVLIYSLNNKQVKEIEKISNLSSRSLNQKKIFKKIKIKKNSKQFIANISTIMIFKIALKQIH